MEDLERESSLQKLDYGDHICFLFNDLEDYRYIAVNFITEGLLKNEKILFVVDEYPIELLIKDLKNNNIDAGQFIDTGQLIISSNKNIYASSQGFDPQEAINNWKLLSANVKKESFSGLRAMGEMLFAVNGEQDSFEKLMEYEVSIHREVLEAYEKRIDLCIFNKSKFPAYVLEDMIKKHNVVINNKNIIKPNPYYIDFDTQLKEYNKKVELRKHFSLNTNKCDEHVGSSNNEENNNIEILKHVLSATGDGTWELDISSRQIEVRGTFNKTTGYAKDKLYYNYSSFMKLIHPADSQELIDIIEKCCANQVPYLQHELRIRKENGEWEWIRIMGIPIKTDVTNGRILKLVGIFNNISESKKIKRELEEAIYFEKLRTDFFANLSHEFRTPLNVILGSIQLQELYMNKDFHNENGDKYGRSIKSMKQNCYRLLRLVNNLIDITKIDSGFYNIDLENYDIVGLVREIVVSVQDYVRKQRLNIQFNTNIDKAIIACDPEKIERIMLNLLSNSIKFTEDGGKITVDVNKDQNQVAISIEDTGHGIPQHKLSDIFNRFTQLNNSLTRSHEGSGIGLSLVKSLVELQGGTIAVESELNKGSRFTIHLPIRVVNKENYDKKELFQKCAAKVESMHIEFSDIYSEE